jgi:hypothetical protein
MQFFALKGETMGGKHIHGTRTTFNPGIEPETQEQGRRVPWFQIVNLHAKTQFFCSKGVTMGQKTYKRGLNKVKGGTGREPWGYGAKGADWGRFRTRWGRFSDTH